MCYAKPGPRCSNCTSIKLNRLKKWKKRLPESPNIDKKIADAQKEYDKTKRGMKELRVAGETTKADEYQKEYKEAINAYKASIKTENPMVTTVSQDSEAISKKLEEISSIRSELHALNNKIGVIKTPVYHDTTLTDDEIESEKKVIELGEKLESLSAHYGAPTEEEWDSVRNVYDTKKEDLRLVMEKSKEDMDKAEIEAEDALDGDSFDEVDRLDDIYKDKKRKYYENLRAYDSPEVDETGYKKLVTQRASAYRSALEATGVEFAQSENIEVKTWDNKENNPLTPAQIEAQETIKTAAAIFPKKWIENSNNFKYNLNVSFVSGVRAGYSGIGHVIRLDPADKNLSSTAAHELTHRIETANLEVGNQERLFLNRRAGLLDYSQGVTKKKPQVKTVYSGRSEWGYSGGFPNAYVGKVYDYRNNYTKAQRERFNRGDACYEVMSMGTEMVFFGKMGGGEGYGAHTADTNYKNFVLGMFASTGNNK